MFVATGTHCVVSGFLDKLLDSGVSTVLLHRIRGEVTAEPFDSSLYTNAFDVPAKLVVRASCPCLPAVCTTTVGSVCYLILLPSPSQCQPVDRFSHKAWCNGRDGRGAVWSILDFC